MRCLQNCRKLFYYLGLTLLMILPLCSKTVAQGSSADSVIAILMQADAVPDDAILLKKGELTGNSMDSVCAYYELLQQARGMGVSMKANLIKIENRKNHSNAQGCDILTISWYSSSKAHLAEQSFEWNAHRPLTWDDFKGPVRAGTPSTTAAETNCGMAIETNLVTSKRKAKVYVYNTFDKKASWVREGKKLDEILEHEQGHWNICEIYTRKMQAAFDAQIIMGDQLNATATKIYNKISQEYQQRQQAYENETQHGMVVSEQKRWTLLLNNELQEKLTGKL